MGVRTVRARGSAAVAALENGSASAERVAVTRAEWEVTHGPAPTTARTALRLMVDTVRRMTAALQHVQASPATTTNSPPGRGAVMSPDRPDGRTPPDGGSRSCRLDRARTRGGDGQPTTIHVARTGGAHVTAADVRWMHDRLDPREDQ